MTPVRQTRFGVPEGNCLMASIASILDIPLSVCPDLHDHEQRGENYWTVMTAFLRQRGYQPVWMTPDYLGGYVPKGYAAVSGPGARGADHVCVALDGRIVHDPLPVGNGLLSVNGYIVLVPVDKALSDPARLTPVDEGTAIGSADQSSSLYPSETPEGICMFCDGCGWCEGSPAFACPRCNGTGTALPAPPVTRGSHDEKKTEKTKS